jgi:glycerol-3-phosphate dehydrogenase (NAD(P)+)
MTTNSDIIAVLGAGSWGTALAHLLARKDLEVRLWSRDAETAQRLRDDKQNARYLPDVSLQDIAIHHDLNVAINGANWIVSAVPCAALPELARQTSTRCLPSTVVVSGTKGLHPETSLLASQTWASAGLDEQRFVVLSGPNLAREVAQEIPTSSVVASRNEDALARAQKLFSTSSFRVYTNDDLLGVELGGALKNVVAIAAGISDGLGFGDNAKAALMTRAWREMTRLATALGARESTLFGLSGMGDLIATCASAQSRNHTLGFKLGRGESLGVAQDEIAQVAEGVHTCRAALQLAKNATIELPISSQVAAILFEGRSPREAVEELMKRADCREF